MSILDLDLSHLTPTGTARYTLTQVRIPRTSTQSVVLIVKPSGEANDAYAAALKNAVLKGKVDATAHASIYARHVIVGWEHVHDASGKPVAYTAAGGEELLHGLIDAKRGHDIVGGLMAFCADADHFCAGTDAGDLGNG
jgi:hypothetical protein